MKCSIKKYLTILRLMICKLILIHSELPTVFERDEAALLTYSITRCRHCHRVTFMGMKFDHSSEWTEYDDHVVKLRRTKIKQNKEFANNVVGIIKSLIELRQLSKEKPS